MEAIAAKIEAVMPSSVRQVCKRLHEAGFEALAVGGAVRDAMLDRSPGDWDVATSAHPPEVMNLFSHTIPTGLDHGTVTVVLGKGEERDAIEVTTFRGDGDYTDSRRPDSVVFGVPLKEDLARRDFVINAMAYDPVAQQVADPFGGTADIAARVIRAVGNPIERFTEDGLRVMRAIRFAATLEFDLHPDTEAAIPAALPSLAKVSRERVRVEMLKLLAAPEPSRGLEIGQRAGVFSVAVDAALNFEADAPAETFADWQHAMSFVDAASDPLVRFAALLAFEDAHAGADSRAEAEAHVERRMRELTLSNADRQTVVKLYGAASLWRQLPQADVELRRFLAAIGRERAPATMELLRAQATAFGDGSAEAGKLAAAISQLEGIIDRGDALTAKDLVLSGGDIIKLLEIRPGRIIGDLHAKLLERVLHEPELNEPAALEAVLRELHDGA